MKPLYCVLPVLNFVNYSFWSFPVIVPTLELLMSFHPVYVQIGSQPNSQGDPHAPFPWILSPSNSTHFSFPQLQSLTSQFSWKCGLYLCFSSSVLAFRSCLQLERLCYHRIYWIFFFSLRHQNLCYLFPTIWNRFFSYILSAFLKRLEVKFWPTYSLGSQSKICHIHF